MNGSPDDKRLGVATAETDPTRNVLALVDAMSLRQDDLRRVNAQYQEQLRERDRTHFNDLMSLRANYDEQLRKAETERLDAIRIVDTSAVTTATIALKAEMDPIRKDIAELRRSQYEASGGKLNIKEGQARSNNMVLWVGLGLSIIVGMSTILLSATVIVVNVLLK